jgi:hypothetical protein
MNFKQNYDLLKLAETEKNYNFDFFEIYENSPSNKTQVFIDYCTFVFLRYGYLKKILKVLRVHRVLQIPSNKIMIEFFKKMDTNYK